MFQILLGAGRYFSLLVQKNLFLIFYNHNKNLYNKFEFLENNCIYTF